MLSAITRYSSARPWRVIAVWAIVAVALGLVAGAAAYRVTSDDTARFLPRDAESARAERFAARAFGTAQGASTVTVLVRRADGARLGRADEAQAAALLDRLARWRPAREALAAADDGLGLDLEVRAGRIIDTAVGPRAPDGSMRLLALEWRANTTDPVAQEAFRSLRERAHDDARARGLSVGFTGGVASAADAAEAAEGRQWLAQGLLLGAVVVLSALFFGGVLAAIVPLLAVALVGAAASGLVVLTALALGLRLDTNTPQLISVVLIGIGIDYFLFLLFRVRERLRAGDDRRTAAGAASDRIGPVIASAALVVAAAFAVLGLARFGQFRILGPSIAVSVLVMAFAGLTLMPAIAAAAGNALFWPSARRRHAPGERRAARLGARIARRPAAAALGVTLVLGALAAVAPLGGTTFDLGDGTDDTAAARASERIAAALPAGAADPQSVHVRAAAPQTAATLAPLREAIARVDGVGTVAAPVLGRDRRDARIDVSLDAEPTDAAALRLVRGPLRDAVRRARPEGSTVLVGGSAAVFADVRDVVDRDLRLVLPIAAGLILLILVATLRSVTTSLSLLGAVALEFAATLGAAVLVFQLAGGADGVAFTLPLVLFLFVVALGTDYNILMASRLREELRAGASPRQAAAEAVRHAGPAVAAAGLVLATSFGTLMLEPDAGTRQMGFAMAFGILVASLLVSTVLVPAVTALRERAPGRRAARRDLALEEAPLG